MSPLNLDMLVVCVFREESVGERKEVDELWTLGVRSHRSRYVFLL
jgi:hypothetical protein